MNKKLIITRITAYGLSSLIMLPVFYENLDSYLSLFILGVFTSIFFITRYYSKNGSYKPIHIFTESTLTTIVSFCMGMLFLSVITTSLSELSSGFAILFYGIGFSIFIGAILFIINYIIIIILKVLDKI